ncbi:MAG: hypothetical protein AAB728_05655 [Patescibacteria group bacterium]
MHVRLSFRSHLALLVAFLAFMVFLWMLPALLAGYPYTASEILHQAQAFDALRVLENAGAPLSVLSVWALHPFIGWENILGWSAVSCAWSALALFVWWLCVHRLFDARIAWISTVILSVMPLYWVEAVRMGGYPLAFLLLFAGGGWFLSLFPRHRVVAVLGSAAFYGFLLAVEHTFITFLPFFLLAYLWHRRTRLRWALAECMLFCMTTYAAFMLPLLPNALQKELTPLQRIAVFAPPIDDHYTGYGHLYPDEYAYTFLKEEFDAFFLQRAEQAPFITTQEDKNLLINFKIGRISLWDRLSNGVWLFAHALPYLIFPETVGGVFLWLFILPGIAILCRRRQTLCVHLLGLWLTMELVLRFGFHFVRNHVMDIGWMLALFAAVGIVEIASVLRPHWKRMSVSALSGLIAVVVALQLLQANRTFFARLYVRSEVPQMYAMRDALKHIPFDAVVAYPPGKMSILFFSNNTTVQLHPLTLDFLIRKGRLREPFDYYKVTHIFGYDDATTALIAKELPSIQVVTPAPPVSINVTPFLRYLLHLFR